LLEVFALNGERAGARPALLFSGLLAAVALQEIHWVLGYFITANGVVVVHGVLLGLIVVCRFGGRRERSAVDEGKGRGIPEPRSGRGYAVESPC